jgi:NADH dehydrogenase
MRSKWAAEQAVRVSGVQWTIFRPSLVSGEEGFARELGKLLALKVAPVWGRQQYFFQPVDVDDVATAVAHSLKNPKTRNQVYHLGGPGHYTYRELLQEIAHAKRKKVWFVRLPWFFAFTAGALLGWLPFFPATLENFRLLRQGSVAPEDKWVSELKVQPTPFPSSLAKAMAGA